MLIIDGVNVKSVGGKKHLFELLSYLRYERIEYIVFLHVDEINFYSSIRSRNIIFVNHPSWVWLLVISHLYFCKFHKAIVFSPGGIYLGRKDNIAMCQNLLHFDPIARGRGSLMFKMKMILGSILARYTFKKAKLGIALTPYVKSLLHEAGCGDVIVIPHGIKYRSDCRVKRVNLQNTIELISVTGPYEYKRNEYLVDLASYCEKNGLDIHISVVGIDRPEIVSSNITYYGFLPNEEVARMMQTSHIGILPSECENLPLTLLELIALGVPTLVAPIPANLFVLPETRYHLSEDLSDVVDKLFTIVSNYDANSGYVLSRSAEFSWEKCNSQHAQAFKTLLADVQK